MPRGLKRVEPRDDRSQTRRIVCKDKGGIVVRREEVEESDRLLVSIPSAYEPRSTGRTIAPARNHAALRAIRVALLSSSDRLALVEDDGAPPVVDSELLEMARVLDRARVARGVARVICLALCEPYSFLEHTRDDGEALFVVGDWERAWGETFLDERDLPAEVELCGQSV